MNDKFVVLGSSDGTTSLFDKTKNYIIKSKLIRSDLANKSVQVTSMDINQDLVFIGYDDNRAILYDI